MRFVPTSMPRSADSLANLDVLFKVAEAIVRLEVAVHDVERVQVLHSLGNLECHSAAKRVRHAARHLVEHGPQRAQDHKIGHQKRLAQVPPLWGHLVGDPGPMELDDVRVRDRLQYFALALRNRNRVQCGPFVG